MVLRLLLLLPAAAAAAADGGAALLSWAQASDVVMPDANKLLEVRCVDVAGAVLEGPGCAYGQWSVRARQALPADLLVMRYRVRAEGSVAASLAARKLLSGSSRHRVASVLAKELSVQRQEVAGKATSAAPKTPVTGYTPPQVLQQDLAVQDFAAALELASLVTVAEEYDDDDDDDDGELQRGGWARWVQRGVASTPAYFTAGEAAAVAPAVAADRAQGVAAAAAWWQAAEGLRRIGVPTPAVSNSSLLAAWQLLNARGLRAPEPYGVVVGPHAAFFRQAPTHDVLPGQLSLGLAGDGDNTFVAIRTAGEVAAGSELVLAYATEDSSPQQLLLQYGVLHEGSEQRVSLHFHLTPEDIASDSTGVLAAHGCEPGEFSVGRDGVVSTQDFQCFRLLQLPVTVRSDHRNLLSGKSAKADAWALLASYVADVLARQYGRATPGFNYSDPQEGSFRLRGAPQPEPEQTDDDMPEELKRLVRRDAERRKRMEEEAAAEGAEASAKEAEVAAPETETGPPGPEQVVGLPAEVDKLRMTFAASADVLELVLGHCRQSAEKLYSDLVAQKRDRLLAQAREAQQRAQEALEDLNIDRMAREGLDGEDDDEL